MNKTKIKYMLICIMFTMLAILTISYATDNLELENIPDFTNVSGIPVIKNIEVPYAFKSSSYANFDRFGLDYDELNPEPTRFCGEKDVHFGNEHIDHELEGPYHISNILTNGKVGTGKTSDPKGDIDTSVDVYCDAGGNLVRKNGTYYGYRENTGRESPSGSVKTNWVYIENARTFDCEEAYSNGYFSGGAMAFLLACYKAPGYRDIWSDPLQWAVWGWLNQTTAGCVYYADAQVFDSYHKASENPNVDCTPGDNVGTVLNGDTYHVGPFQMSNYVRAQDFSLPHRYGNLQAAFDSQGDYKGTIVKAEAVMNNGARVEFPVPEPGAVFYIDLPGSQITGADEIVDIVFTYQRIHASGNGSLWKGYAYIVSYKESSSWQGCGTYYCSRHPEHAHSGDGCSGYCPGHTRHPGCDHANGVNNCESYSHPGGCVCLGNHTDCHGHSRLSYGPYGDKALCSHGHWDCYQFEWQYTGHTNECQDGFAGNGTLSIEVDTFTIRVSIPVKTVMKIYKYITKVDHVGENINVIPENKNRREMTMEEKEKDPVPVERGDLVTYKIEIVNESRFPTRAKVKDTLPKDCEKIYMPPEIEVSQWIEVDAKSTREFIVQVVPIKDTGKDTNTIEFITKNDTAEHMQFVYWGEDATHGPRRYGNIVNTDGNDGTTNLKEKDSDTYVIKEYNVSIEKFIYDVSHNKDVNLGSVAAGLDTSVIHNSEERNRKSLGSNAESIKKANPVYVEYGDIVTYKIVVYNTTDNTGTDFDIPSRDSEPYWQPDKVYVNIKDTLPMKYSGLEIKVENAPAPDSRVVGTSSAGANGHTISGGATESNSGGEFTIKDLMVPAGQIRIVTVTLKVEEHGKGTIEENNAKFDPEDMRNINKGPSGRRDNKYCVIKNNSSNLETSDWYILNNYNTFTDKYVYKYYEEMQHKNEREGYSIGGYVSNADGTLIKSRRNDSAGTSTVTDAHGMIDKVKVVDSKEKYKKQYPVSVEKTENIVYRIAITNEAKEARTVNTINSGRKPATQVRTSTVKDKMQEGLTFKRVSAAIYRDENGENKRVDVQVRSRLIGTESKDGRTFNVYEYTVGNESIVNPGETIIYEVEVVISESNMYLFDLENNATLTRLTNINHTDSKERDVKNKNYNEDISPQDKEGTSDFVRMKDLVIGGWVWVDFDKNGLKDDKARNDSDKAYFNIDNNAMKRDVVVKLYRVQGGSGDLIRTTKTDSKGFYTFGKGRDNAFGWRTNDYNYAEGLSGSDTYKAGSNFNLDYYQRVEKATNKDDYGNYQGSSQLIKYYIEFEYDGVVFKSTEFYSGMDNLDKNTGSNTYGAAIKEYKKPGDSNALEFTDVREEFNKKYEYIGYDKAYDLNKANGASLAFDKTNHTSQLIEDPSRTITARSFIKADTIKGRYDLNHAGWNPAPCTSSLANTNTLWLFDFDSSKNNYETPETEYLKDINLGLELREDVDITLTKDVYSVRTTINGEQMEYFYNQNNSFNGEVKGANAGKYLNDYIIKTPYGLDLYESDYKMRVEQYKSNAVKTYKGENGESELNTEVTYRITIANKSINDDETLPAGKMRDTKFKVRISEILDLYDTNFKKVFEGETKVNPINIKLTNEKGYLEDATIEVAEAWYFKEDPNGDYIIGEGTFPSTYTKGAGRTSHSSTAAPKPVFVKADSTAVTGGTRYKKVNLTLSSKSMLEGGNSGKENSNKFDGDGYNTLYISGMEFEEGGTTPIYIEEGKDFDIYVKYVLDKAELESKNTNTDYNETTEETFYLNDADKNKVKVVINKTGGSVKIQRSLKLKDNFGKDAATGRGIENIAQVNLYSVWYENGKPTSLVDMDSNAGNIGNTNDGLVAKLKNVSDTATRKGIIEAAKRAKSSNQTSADIWNPYYEDMTYKTGIEITADGTEWTYEEAKKMHGELELRENETIRELSGMVWDDSRTEIDSAVAGAKDVQYSADGIYDAERRKDNGGLTNINVPTNYENEIAAKGKGTPDEEQDIKVRNAKAELIEIVEIPQGGGNASHYYEEVLRDVTWKQAQHIRTKQDGTYTVKGFIPGKYIVRFTYGDTIDRLTNAEMEFSETAQVEFAATDMQIFNGQDYKSTKYAYELNTDYTTDSNNVAGLATTEGTIDKYATRHYSPVGSLSDNDVVMTALERPDLSDARDDEIRRLEVNDYSEIMINEKAEVLKGLANSSGLSETEIAPENPAIDKGLKINYYKYFENGEFESEKNKYLTELTDNTYMEAETVEFLVKPEKLTHEQTTTETYYAKLSGGKDFYYNNLDTIVNKIITKRKYKIENIDMGVEYRPETNISLAKEIDTVQLVTSDNEVLVDLKLETKIENGKTVHYIDKENSKGAENVQIVSNTYDVDPLLAGILNVYDEQRQGFIYVAVDNEILQGCRVVITYKFSAQNNSEVDRITKRLNEIRFYGNSKTRTLEGTYPNLYSSKTFTIDGEEVGFKVLNTLQGYDVSGNEKSETEYTANNLAKNIVKFDVYTEDGDNISYRNRAKTMILDEINNNADADGSNGYFGKYVGYTYYVGNNSNLSSTVKSNKEKLDTISELKFDVVIDYVDTDLEFEQVSQSEGVKFSEVGASGSALEDALSKDSDVVKQFGIANQNWSNTSSLPATNLSRYLFKLNSPWSELTESLKIPEITNPIAGAAADMLKDIQGIKYKSLVMTVSDKMFDSEDGEESDERNDTSNNKLFSKFLEPSVVNEEKSIATVYLPVSKLLATESDTDNMVYENIAEVSQFTVLTGRRTNFDTTIGNVDIYEVQKQNEERSRNSTDDPYEKYGSIEYVTAALEKDTSSTETITLTPPTGLMRNRRVIYEAIDTTSNVMEIAVISIAVVVTILIITKFTIVKIKKKRYK